MEDNSRNQSEYSAIALTLFLIKGGAKPFVRARARSERHGEEMAEEGDPQRRLTAQARMTCLSFRDTQFILSERSGEISLCLRGLAPTAITCF